MSGLTGIFLPLAIGLIIFVVVFLLITVFSRNIEKTLNPVIGKYLESLKQEFTVLNIPVTAERFLAIQAGVAILFFVVGLILGEGILSRIFMGILMCGLGFYLSTLYLKQMKAQRRTKFEEQFVDAIALVGNGVRSGLSLMQALELTVSEMSEPISSEINLVIQATRVGVPLDAALSEWAERVNSDDLDIFVTAIIIQSQTGGNLSEVLETLVKTIRERFRIQRQIRTLTSQGIASAYILTFLPVVLGVVLYFIQPQTMSLMFTTNYGLLLTLAAMIMISIGGFIVRKIITIDI